MTTLPTTKYVLDAVYSDNFDEITTICESLVSDNSVQAVNVLLSSLRDDDDYYHEMTALMQSAEATSPVVYYAAFTETLSSIYEIAPNCCQTIIERNLNAPLHALTFSVAKLVKQLKHNKSACSIFIKIARKLYSQKKVSEDAWLLLNSELID